MNLVGKTREQIEDATRNKTRSELVDLLYDLATFEPMFKPQELATRRRMSKRVVMKLVHDGVIRAHQCLGNAVRIPLSAIHEWDKRTALFTKEELNGQ